MTPSRTDLSLRHHRLYRALLASGLLLGGAPTALAASFVVDSLLDTADAAPGDGQAEDSQGRTTLRAAIQEADALGGTHDIGFAATLTASSDASIELSLFDSGADTGEIGPTAFVLRSGTSLSIDGPAGDNGVQVRRASAASAFRFFHVRTGAALTLRRLTLSGGSAVGGSGGAGSGAGGGGAAGLGGALVNEGSLTLDAVTLSGNTALGGSGSTGSSSTSGGGGSGGGGLAANGTGGGTNSVGNGGGPDGGLGGNPGASGGVGGGGGGGNRVHVAGGSATGRPGGAGGLFGGGGAGGAGSATGGGVVATGGPGGVGGFGGGGGGGGKGRAPGQTAIGGPGSAGGFAAGVGSDGQTGDSGEGGDGGGGAGLGGAIFNYGGTLQLRNSTLSGNTARGGSSGFAPGPYGSGVGPGGSGGAGSGFGAAIFSINRGATAASVELRHVTIAANTVSAGQHVLGTDGAGNGAVMSLGNGGSASLVANNSIFADTNGGSDIVVTTINGGASSASGSGNLVESQSGFAGGIVSSADPNLAALLDNRGPSATHALQLPSPALDSGDPAQLDGLVTDQRGGIFARVADGNIDGSAQVDIGAFELIQIDYGDAPDFASGTGAVEALLAQGLDDQRLTQVGPNGDTARSASAGRLAWNAQADEFLLVFTANELASGEFEIYGRRIDGATRLPIGAAFRISQMGPEGDTNYFASQPDVAWSSLTNEYLVTWSGDHSTPGNDENEIFGRFVDAGGTPLGSQLRVSQMGADGDTNAFAGAARVAYADSANEFLVVWNGDEPAPPLVDNEFEIFGRRVSAATRAPLATHMQISAMGGANGSTTYTAFSPALAWNPLRDQFLVVWQADDNGAGGVDNEVEIHGRFVAGGGAPLGAAQFRISRMGPDGDTAYRANNPALAYNDDADEFLVAWHGNDADAALALNEVEIFAQRVDGFDGTLLDARLRVSDMGVPGVDSFFGANPAVAYGAATDNYLLAWSGDQSADNEQEIWARRVGGDGAPQDADEVRVSNLGPDGSTDYGAFSAALAYNGGNGDALVVWGGDDDVAPLVNDEQEIFGQFFTDTPLVDYRARGADGGPAHIRSLGLQLGAAIDSDPDGQPTLDASGDDGAGADDEDGVSAPIEFAASAPTVMVDATNLSGAGATLFGWIDYDGDGLFENPGERASVVVPNGSNDAPFTLTFPAPPVNAVINTFARFRLASGAAAALPDGLLSDGEVEDYPATNTLDTLPDVFAFVDQTDVPRDTLVVSAPITVSGINAPTQVTVVDGAYSIDGGAFASAPGSVLDGQQVRVRHLSGDGFSEATATTLSIGGVSDTFTSVTAPPDTVPDAFSFVDQQGVTNDSAIASAPIVVAGIDGAAPITVSGGSYSINGGSATSLPGSVQAGDQVQAHHTSSPLPGTTVDTTVSIGGVFDVFSSTTRVPGADAAVSKTDGQTLVAPGALLTYTLQAQNVGTLAIVDAQLVDDLPATLTAVSWSCSGAGGGSCGASGTGDIADTIDLPIGASVTYSVNASVTATATGSIVNQVTVTLTGGQLDPDPSNNSASDTTLVTRIFRNGFE